MSEKNQELPMFFSYFEWALAHKKSPTEKGEVTRASVLEADDSSSLSMVQIDQDYIFEGPEGQVSLLDLFDGRGQLIIGHFMFDPSWDQGCPHCSSAADQITDDSLKYLNDQDTSFVYVSRAPLAKIERYKHSKGWSFPWYSSNGTDYNYDFGATTEEGEVPGGSVFRRHGDSVFQVNNDEAPTN